MIDPKKKVEVGGGVSPVVAGVAGVVLGAGMAAVGMMAAKNDDLKEKVKGVVGEVKKGAADYVGGIRDKAEESKEDLKNVINEATDKLREQVEITKKKVDKKWKK